MTKPSMSDQIMGEIHAGRLDMRPRWHFIALSGLGLASLVLLAGVSAYLVDVISLAIRIQIINRPMYGARAHLSDLITDFPWWAVMCAVLTLGLAVWLIRRSSRLYRWPIAWVILTVMAIAMALGLAWSALPISGNHPNSGLHQRGSYQQLK